MADPLSLTLAAVTLAAALKDMVELAQMIQESCEKVSRNRRELHALASEIKMTVSQLKKFGDDHHDILCDAVDMKASLLGLIIDMRAIYDKCREMFPPIPPKRLEKFKVAFNIWMNRNRMEEDIKDLRNRVNKCHSQFMMFTVMRIEAVMRRQHKVDHRQSHQEIAAVGASDDSLIAFVHSNSARPSSKLPPGITADFIADTYICLQIDVIDGMSNQLSLNSYPVEEPLEVFLLPFQLFVYLASPYDKYTIRQELVRDLCEIQSYLRSDSEDLSIQAGALAMMNLSAGLQALKLYEEGHTIAKWTVNIFRALTKINPEIYLPYLVQSLYNHSICYSEVDNIDGSYSAIAEAVDISRSLQSSTTNIHIEFQLADVLRWLSSRLYLLMDNEASSKAAQESVDIYHKVIHRNHEQTSYGLPVQLFDSQWTSFFAGIPRVAIIDYGEALDQLSFSFEQLGRLEDAFNTAKKALDVMTFYTDTFIDQTSEIKIARILIQISQEDYHEFMTLEEALSFSEQAVALFRVHCLKDVEEHIVSLCAALYQQAAILVKMERKDEAFVLSQEANSLMDDIITDQLAHAEALSELSWILRYLRRLDEAVLNRMKCVTVYTEYSRDKAKEAKAYYDLGVELSYAGREPEAIKALQAALTQYRALAFKDPETHSQNIGSTLNQLMANFICCKEFDHAFNEGHESLKLHQTLLENDASVIEQFFFAIELNCRLAEVADNEDKCVERARYSIACARNIARKHPLEGKSGLTEIIQRSAMVLYRFNRFSEAEIVIQESLKWHEQNTSQDEKDVERYMLCLLATNTIVYGQGYCQKGVQYLQKSIDVGRPHSSHYLIYPALVQSMCRRVRSLYFTGLYGEAVEAGKECVAFARQNATEDDIDELMDCLHVTATAFHHDGKLDDASVHIQEALELPRSDKIIKSLGARPAVLLREAQCLTDLSRILADVGQEVQALVEGKAAVEKALGLKSEYFFLPWSEIEPTYIDALETYSLCLAASGDLSGALDRLTEVRSYYERQINSRPGDSLRLGPVLYAEGILCCAAGRPDDGAAAVPKLHNLQSRLRTVHPELAKNVEVHLKRERTFPSMVALIKKFDLRCDHEH